MRGAIDAIYWKLHTAYLKNKRDDALFFLEMLEDSLKESKNPEQELSEIQFNRLNLIRNQVYNQTFGRLYNGGYDCPAEHEFNINESDLDEKQFCKYLYVNKRYIFDITKTSSKGTIIREYEMDPYGRCDFLIKEGRVWKLVEVKMGIAPNSVVSQIDRYRVCAELEMALGRHDVVEAYVVAGSFPSYVVSELSRSSVIMVSHNNQIDSLCLLN